MSGYEIASLTELESVQAVGTLRWTPLRKHFGITAFGVSAYTAGEAGQDVVEEHTEEALGHEELYVVVSRQGDVRARRRGDGRACRLGRLPERPEGEAVRAREEPGTTVLAIGGKPGSHDVSAWEYFFMAYGIVDEDPDRAVAEIQAGLAEKPDHAALHVHLACIYARAGRLDEARTRLDRGLELDPEAPEVGGEDEDLEPLRASD